MKRDQHPLVNRLRRQRNALQRKIDKINGKRILISWWLVRGETWVASSINGNLGRIER